MAQAARLNLRMQKELKLLLTDPPPGASFPLLSDSAASSSSSSSSFSLSSIDAHNEESSEMKDNGRISDMSILISEMSPMLVCVTLLKRATILWQALLKGDL